MADRDELDPETAALKSGLGPFYGRMLAALEALAAAATVAAGLADKGDVVKTPRRKTDA